MEEDDDMPQLSAHTLLALQEYLREQAGQDEDGEGDGDEKGEVSLLSEDWRMSQFWYDEDTAATVASEVHHLASSNAEFRVACIACPTLFVELKKSYPNVSAHLFEYDQRFEKYGSNFTFYDYNHPDELPQQHSKAFHLVVADPPYLSEECLRKTVESMRYMAADSKEPLYMVLTGAVQESLVEELLKARPCVFRPVHRNKLGNEFMLFTNYDPLDRLGGWEKQANHEASAVQEGS